MWGVPVNMQYPSGMITHAYRSSGLLPDRRVGLGDGLTVDVGEITGTDVRLSLGVFVAMNEPVEGVTGVGLGVDLDVSVGTRERVDGVAGIVAGVEVGVADADASGCACNVSCARPIASPSANVGTSGVAVVGAVGSAKEQATPKESTNASRSSGRSFMRR